MRLEGIFYKRVSKPYSKIRTVMSLTGTTKTTRLVNSVCKRGYLKNDDASYIRSDYGSHSKYKPLPIVCSPHTISIMRVPHCGVGPLAKLERV